jgi:hypothetical protein
MMGPASPDGCCNMTAISDGIGPLPRPCLNGKWRLLTMIEVGSIGLAHRSSGLAAEVAQVAKLAATARPGFRGALKRRLASVTRHRLPGPHYSIR